MSEFGVIAEEAAMISRITTELDVLVARAGVAEMRDRGVKVQLESALDALRAVRKK